MHADAGRFLARLYGVAAVGKQVQRIGQDQQGGIAAGEAAEVKHIGQVRDDQSLRPRRPPIACELLDSIAARLLHAFIIRK